MKKIAILGLAILAGASLSTVAEARQHGGEKPAFTEIDTDGNGEVTQDELRAFGTTRAADRFDAADTNADGKLSVEELAAARDTRVADRITQMVERLDTDGDGMVSKDEMQARADARGENRVRGERGERGGKHRDGQRGGHNIERMFDRADTDDNGTLNAAEWEAMGQRGQRGSDN